ncbi:MULTISPECIES: phenylalanine--tRNA ligase subunit beta [unclassified Meiothermus]|uniref:phenylalanine--tRNA ligase subunit beta n=1 Tax=unclassified Meiothermus TaxID=370471 RepID=UPI000D7D0D12|nr:MULTISPECIES: phenylalanine--tRNA ligase subunit beta [unclassified Meiothermus]PZA06137.1 phenylalanine--tRNA ligase subunit beta [Meiothermus sp. Pnk-1]RYM36223.1 phenylalanine--tRNA ligase subunit beta [Meiothermus sp. PNK-Is4]
MRIVYSWLKEFLPDAPKPERLEELLAGLGHETEAIERLSAPHRRVVFARVLSVEEIPGLEVRKLILDAGREVQVISGAPNARAGMGVALALPGAVLPGGLEIAVRKIQGRESYGMALSAKELAVGEYAAGLMELPAGALPPGTSLAEAWSEDWVIELEITPNRADMLSVYGTARDLAALGMTLIHPDPRPKTASIPLPFRVWIDDPTGCDRFTLWYAQGIRNTPSPLVVQRRLYAAGMRPISLVVDATNYTMLELGNPLHAYDARFIGEGIRVRRARRGEKLVTLDGVEREFDERDLLITVEQGGQSLPEGIAGVMGGARSEVREDTTEVALEVAHFDPVSIRRTAKRQGLKTEASYRFERGVDPDGQVRSALRFMELVQQWQGEGALVAEEHLDLNHTQPPRPIAFRPSQANQLIGASFAEDEQLAALKRLGFQVVGEAEPYQVTPPSYRMDIEIAEDLVEEVARIIGYDKIPVTLPAFFPAPDNLGVDEPYEAKEQLKRVLVGLGFQEVVNYSWSSPEELAKYRAPAPTVALANPQASDRTHLRTAIYPGLLRNLELNLAQGEEGPFLLFEIGNVFNQTETARLGMLLSGEAVPGLWQPGLAGSFYALKGLLESTAAHLGATLRVEQEGFAHLHPGVSGAVYWNGRKVGSIGQLHPAIAAQAELPTTYLVELELPLPKAKTAFKDVAKYPASLRDLAVVVPEAVPYGEVERILRESAGEYLEALQVFDVYRGSPLEPGQKSLAFHLSFRHPERTLTDAETDGYMQNVIRAVEAAGYAIRR